MVKLIESENPPPTFHRRFVRLADPGGFGKYRGQCFDVGRSFPSFPWKMDVQDDGLTGAEARKKRKSATKGDPKVNVPNVTVSDARFPRISAIT